MSKFNQKSRGTKTINRAGGSAYKESDKLEFISLILTSFLNDHFYESSQTQLERMKSLVMNLDSKFVAKTAIYARNEFGMRSITHAIMGELAFKVKGEEWTKNAFEKIIHRPDDMTEALSYYMNNYGKPIPNSLKKGLSLAANKFNEYQLAKYRGEGKEVSMVDLFNIVHPTPVSIRQSVTFKNLINGELRSSETWESMQTKSGQIAETEEEKADLKNQNWRTLLEGNKLGYMALLRNLRNIITQAPDCIELACERLISEEAIKKSLVLPFRFSVAMDQISDRRVIEALNKAIEISLNNVPRFDGKTLIALDDSGSMNGSYGKTADGSSPISVGSLFASALYKTNDADILLFDTDSRFLKINPSDSLSTIRNEILRNNKGGGTNFHSIFNLLTKSYDRIIILSDGQGWIGYDTPVADWKKYNLAHDVDSKIFSFNLVGYGDMQFPEKDVYCLTGFSDKVFDLMKVVEQDKQALINKIESVEL